MSPSWGSSVDIHERHTVPSLSLSPTGRLRPVPPAHRQRAPRMPNERTRISLVMAPTHAHDYKSAHLHSASRGNFSLSLGLLLGVLRFGYVRAKVQSYDGRMYIQRDSATWIPEHAHIHPPVALALLGPLTQRNSDLRMPVPSAIVMVAGDNYSAK